MACLFPNTAYYSREVGKSGKRGITFDRNASFSGVPMQVPCGQCVNCRLDHSRQWAVRCMHENQMHECSSFVTLTYDNDHNPITLVRRDMQLLLKRMRKSLGRFRFYGCGEYGETTWRPHYHLLLFGLHFKDRQFYKMSPRDEKLYTSDILFDLWPYGMNVIGEVTFDSAAYCARYVTKKITGDKADAHYARYDAEGRAYKLLPEFGMYSRRPGIGKTWFDKYSAQTYQWDSVVLNGREIRPPRYYDTQFELLDSACAARFSSLKVTRRRRSRLFRFSPDNSVARRRVREVVALKRLHMYGRDFK